MQQQQQSADQQKAEARKIEQKRQTAEGTKEN
jgi:hypothetical protein